MLVWREGLTAVAHLGYLQLKDIDVRESRCLTGTSLALCEVPQVHLVAGELGLGREGSGNGQEASDKAGGLHDGRHCVWIRMDTSFSGRFGIAKVVCE